MNMRANEQLCMNLLTAESEKEVIAILKKAGYWNNLSSWQPFGGSENNWSAIGNQQGNPVSALVEKLVNSIDAVLMLECMKRGIDPESVRAPQSIDAAVEQFFGVSKGHLTNITAFERTQLSTRIGLIATGRKQTPNYIIFDTGEGQSAKSLPNTILSISKSNKLKIPFVQGKFNMGGTGVLPFCGKENFQLIVSRRNPDIVDRSDETSSYWSFTVVRREEASEGRRSSMFTYLALDGQIPYFDAKAVHIPVPNEGTQTIPELEWGTVLKLYEYEITGYKSLINVELYTPLSTMLYRPSSSNKVI